MTLREYRNHTVDSTRWHDFPFREGDIVIANWAKSGSTWLQQIVGQLIFNGSADISVAEISPWVELRTEPWHRMLRRLDSQTHRRFLKSHLAAHFLPLSPQARYLYIARDGRDVAWSWFNHHSRLTKMAYRITNAVEGRVGPRFEPPSSAFPEYFNTWLDRDGFPLWPFWSHVQSWWDVRDRANVLLLHHNDLKADLEGQMRRIARFLDIELNEAVWPSAIQHCTFSYMKQNGWKLSALLDATLIGGVEAFMHKGVSRDWQGQLGEHDIRKYEEHAAANLTPDCRRWLASGGDVHPTVTRG